MQVISLSYTLLLALYCCSSVAAPAVVTTCTVAKLVELPWLSHDDDLDKA